MGSFFTVLVLSLCGMVLPAQVQEPPPPPPPHGPHGPRPPKPPLGPHPGERLPELRRRFERLRPVNEAARTAIGLSGYFLQRAEQAETDNKRFQADRYASAADAQIHIADRQQHSGIEPLAHARGSVTPREAVARHLERAYFRLQQAAYFLSQSRDAHAKDLPQTGRQFYESAAQAYDKGDYLQAEADAKCVDDTVRTLEELAQAASPMPPPSPPPPPPPPPQGPR